MTPDAASLARQPSRKPQGRSPEQLTRGLVEVVARVHAARISRAPLACAGMAARMVDQDQFAPLARQLRAALLQHYRDVEKRPEAVAWGRTLATNSDLVAVRGQSLVQIMLAASGRKNLQGAEILDLGMGFGALAVYLASCGARVTGIDRKPDRPEVGLAVAHEHDLQLKFLPASFDRLPVPPRTFDFVVANNSLCYVVDREERSMALGQCLRALRPGGFIVARDANRVRPVDPFSKRPLVHLLPPRAAGVGARLLGRRRSHVRLQSPMLARRELRRAGFVQAATWLDPAASRLHAPRTFARYVYVTARREP
jgi:SAM-dependent methyltransferase